MIQVTVNRKVSGAIQSFEISGHAFFAENGNDIVCAGVSTVSFGTINAVHALTGITPVIKKEESGFLKCVIPDDLPEDISEKVQLLLEGMVVSLKMIKGQYGQYLKLTFKKQEVE